MWNACSLEAQRYLDLKCCTAQEPQQHSISIVDRYTLASSRVEKLQRSSHFALVAKWQDWVHKAIKSQVKQSAARHNRSIKLKKHTWASAGLIWQRKNKHKLRWRHFREPWHQMIVFELLIVPEKQSEVFGLRTQGEMSYIWHGDT